MRILILLVKINFLVSKKAIALVVILIQITNLEHCTRVHGDEVSDGGVHRNGGAHEVEDVFLLGDRVLDALNLGEQLRRSSDNYWHALSVQSKFNPIQSQHLAFSVLNPSIIIGS